MYTNLVVINSRQIITSSICELTGLSLAAIALSHVHEIACASSNYNLLNCIDSHHLLSRWDQNYFTSIEQKAKSTNEQKKQTASCRMRPPMFDVHH